MINVVFGILYDEGRLYLFKSNGKNYFRLSDEFNNENKGKFEPTFDIPDGYSNLLSLPLSLWWWGCIFSSGNSELEIGSSGFWKRCSK